jgi:hypothetical protein
LVGGQTIADVIGNEMERNQLVIKQEAKLSKKLK